MKRIKHYKIVELLGSGAMGEVYLAFDTALERDVAIKVMHRHLSSDKKTDKRFIREARAVASLIHPNIVTIYEVGKAKQSRYIVMEYVPGSPLTNILNSKGMVEVKFAIELITQILSGLTCAHGKGIFHRDIKPDNILITPDNNAKILDFGIAKMVTKASLTAAGDILGTVEYMAPEQMLGETIDHRCDIYATGVVLYQMLTRRLPFIGENPVEILYKALQENPRPLSYYNHQISSEVNRAVLKAISKDKEERWEDAESFLEALNSLLANGNHPVALETSKPVESSELYIGINVEDGDGDEKEMHSVFVGREEEFKRLVTSFGRASGGRGQTVILKGEAGVGKSALAKKLTQYAQRRQAFLLYGTCLYQDGLGAYLPYIDALRKFFCQASQFRSSKEVAKLKKMVGDESPLLLEFVKLLIGDPALKSSKVVLKEDFDKNELFQALYQLIELMARIRPVVVTIDDLHLADKDSLRLFHYLSHNLTHDRVLLLGTCRTERYDLQREGKPTMIVDTLVRIGREISSEEITLFRLNRESCDHLIDSSLCPSLFTEEFYELIQKVTKGNPLFVLETLRLLRDSEAIFFKEGVWYNKPENSNIKVPQKVEDVFIQRLNALSKDERDILQVAAVIGNKFDASQLERLLEMTRIKLLKILQRVETELQIIVSTESGFHFDPMLREILYSEIPLPLRREYHLMLASDFENGTDGDFDDIVGEVSQHLRRAGEHAKAAPLLYQAAHRSFSLGAYQDASSYIEDYLDSMGKIGKPNSESIANFDLHFKLGRCYEETGRWSESVDSYKLLVELSKKKAEPNVQADGLACVGRMQLKLGDYENALETFNRCLRIVEKYQISNVLGGLYNSLGSIYLYKEDFDKAQHFYQQTIQQVDDEDVQFNKANALTNLGIIASLRADYDLALNSYEKALKAYISRGDKKNQARIYHNIGTTYTDQGRWSKSIDAFERCLQLTEQVEDKQLRGLIYLNMGKAYAKQEDLSKAKKYAEKALKMFKLMGDVPNVAEAYHVFGLINRARGNFSEAELFLNESISLNKQKENLDGLADAYETYAELCWNEGYLTKAREYYKEAEKACQKLNLQVKVLKLKKTIDELDLDLANSAKVEKRKKVPKIPAASPSQI